MTNYSSILIETKSHKQDKNFPSAKGRFYRARNCLWHLVRELTATRCSFCQGTASGCTDKLWQTLCPVKHRQDLCSLGDNVQRRFKSDNTTIRFTLLKRFPPLKETSFSNFWGSPHWYISVIPGYHNMFLHFNFLQNI